MRKILPILLLIPFLAKAQHSYVTVDTTFGGWNAIETYDPNSNDSVEMIISFVGAGEVGVGPSFALYGPHYWIIDEGWDGGIVLGNGTHYPVYVTLRQPNQSQKPPATMAVVQQVYSRFKVKSRAKYFTGYSAGGWQWEELASYQATTGDQSYAKQVTAGIGVQSVVPSNIFDGTPSYPSNMGQMSRYTNMLGFNQINDGGRQMNVYLPVMNDSTPGSAVGYNTDTMSGSHCCFMYGVSPYIIWTSTTPSYVTGLISGSQINMTAMQWLLRQGDTSTGGAPVEIPPSANAGINQNIQLPTSSVTLSGSGTVNGSATSITGYAWTTMSGPNSPTIVSPTTASTSVTGLIQGTYVFKLTVTDNNGQTGSATMQVVVAAAGNSPPVVSAGSDQTITLPTSSLTITGTASAGSGTLTGVLWAQVSGNSSTIVSPTSNSTSITGLTVGAYKFSFTGTNSNSLSTSDTMMVTVQPNSTGTEVDCYISLYGGTNPSTSAGWNTWNDSASLTKSSLSDINGNLLPYTLSLSGFTKVLDNGASYGSGQTNPIVPLDVLRHSSYATGQVTLNISGLNPGNEYTFSFVGSFGSVTQDTMRIWPSGIVDTLNQQTADNYNTASQFTNITPPMNGQMTFNFIRMPGYAGNFINAIKIIQQGSPVTVPPTAFAGADQLISIPQDSTTLSGSYRAGSATVTQYNWQAISGPRLDTLTIVNPDSSNTLAKNMVPGLYAFKFTVTDSLGGVGVDTMQVRVTSDTGAIQIIAPKDSILPMSQVGGWGNELLRDTTQIILTASAGPNTTGYRWRQISGPVTLQFSSASAQSTNIYDFNKEGLYGIEVMGFNAQDSAKDTTYLTVIDYQTHYSVHPCRSTVNNGPHKVWVVGPTSTGAIFKVDMYNSVFDSAGAGLSNHILGGDTVKLVGGNYQFINLSKFGGSRGCPVVVTNNDSVITVSTAGATPYIRFGSGNDSAIVSYIDFDFTHVPGHLYGLVHNNPTQIAAATGVSCNAMDHCSIKGVAVKNVGIGMFIKNDPDSTQAVQTFNKYRFFCDTVMYSFFDSSVAEMWYWGNTDPNGSTGGDQGKGPSTRVDTVVAMHNYIGHSGYDGAQKVNCVHSEERDNWYLYTGYQNASSQRYVSIIGGGDQGSAFYCFYHNGHQEFTGTPYGFTEIAHCWGDSVYSGGTGAGRVYGIGMFSTNLNIQEHRDSGTIYIHDVMLENMDSFYIRLYNQQNFNSINNPSRVYNNHLWDSTGRTLSQLIQNTSGTQYITNNTLAPTSAFRLQVTDLSSIATGPQVKLSVNGHTATFSSAEAAVRWLEGLANPGFSIPYGSRIIVLP